MAKKEKKEENKDEKKKTEPPKKAKGDIYADSKMQSEYDKLRKDGKTDTQARQIVMLKSR